MSEKVTSKQLAFILFGIIVGYGTMSLPKNTALTGGTTGWIWLILLAIITSIYTYMVWYTGIQFPGQTLVEYSSRLVGKWLGAVIIFLFILYYIGFLISSTSIAVEAVKLTLLSKTPNWFISLVLCAVIYYALTLKLNGLARFSEIYGILVIISTVILIVLMLSQINPLSARPLFTTFNFKIKSMESFTYLVYAFVGFEFIYLIPLSKERKNKTPWIILVTIILIGCIYALLAQASIGILGADSIVYYDEALFTAVRRLNIPLLQIFKRLDGIFFVTFIMTFFTTSALVAYGLSYILSSLFKKLSYKIFSILILSMTFVSTLFLNSYEVIELFKIWVNTIGIGFCYTIPLLLFIIAKVKKHEKKKT